MKTPPNIKPPKNRPKGQGQHGFRKVVPQLYEGWQRCYLYAQELAAKVASSSVDLFHADLAERYSRISRASVYRDLRAAFAQIFNVSPSAFPAHSVQFLRDAVDPTYPHLRRSTFRAFFEGEFTEGRRPLGVLKPDEGRVQVVLQLMDVIETVAFLHQQKATAPVAQVPTEVGEPAAPAPESNAAVVVETEAGSPLPEDAGAAEDEPDPLPLPKIEGDASFECSSCGYDVEHYGPPLKACPHCGASVEPVEPKAQDAPEARPSEPEGCADEPPDTPAGLDVEPEAVGAMSDGP